MTEPINKIDFSNSTGAEIECRASGNPPPEIIWVRSDGTAVGNVPGLRQVMANGNLVFPPFRAEDYRQDVHAQVYACLAKNPVGSIISRDVNVRAGKLASVERTCTILFSEGSNGSRSGKSENLLHVRDFSSNRFISSMNSPLTSLRYHKSPPVVTQYYEADVNKEHVIRGNSAVMKCLIPSFVADFVEVVSWHTDENDTYYPRTEIGSWFHLI